MLTQKEEMTLQKLVALLENPDFTAADMKFLKNGTHEISIGLQQRTVMGSPADRRVLCFTRTADGGRPGDLSRKPPQAPPPTAPARQVPVGRGRLDDL